MSCGVAVALGSGYAGLKSSSTADVALRLELIRMLTLRFCPSADTAGGLLKLVRN